MKKLIAAFFLTFGISQSRAATLNIREKIQGASSINHVLTTTVDDNGASMGTCISGSTESVTNGNIVGFSIKSISDSSNGTISVNILLDGQYMDGFSDLSPMISAGYKHPDMLLGPISKQATISGSHSICITAAFQ